MDINRAQEIFNMDKAIEVRVDGSPVWIEHVDAANNTAIVYLKDNPANKKTVSVTELQEA